MIGSSKNNTEIIRENSFERKKKKPGLNLIRDWGLIGLPTTGPVCLIHGQKLPRVITLVKFVVKSPEMLSYVAQIRNFIMLDNILTSYQSFIMLFSHHQGLKNEIYYTFIKLLDSFHLFPFRTDNFLLFLLRDATIDVNHNFQVLRSFCVFCLLFRLILFVLFSVLNNCTHGYLLYL